MRELRQLLNDRDPSADWTSLIGSMVLQPYIVHVNYLVVGRRTYRPYDSHRGNGMVILSSRRLGDRVGRIVRIFSHLRRRPEWDELDREEETFFRIELFAKVPSELARTLPWAEMVPSLCRVRPVFHRIDRSVVVSADEISSHAATLLCPAGTVRRSDGALVDEEILAVKDIQRVRALIVWISLC